MGKKMIITRRNCRISIDTMELTAKLTHAELEELQSYIAFDRSSKSEALRHYEGVYHLKQFGFTMKVQPRIRQWRRYYNARITLHKAFFEVESFPNSLMELVHMFKWSITNLHLAFDYPSNFSPLVYKHHHKVTYEQLIDAYGHTSQYFGSRGTKMKIDCEDDIEEKWIHRKNNIAILYDRNEKEISRGMNEEPQHEYSKRYEARMIFKIGELLLSDINHARVAQELSKRILIADLKSSAIHEYAKRPLRKLQINFNEMKWLEAKWKRNGKNPSNERKRLKAIVMEHREPLADMYLEYCDELFSVFDNVLIMSDAESNHTLAS